MKKIGKIVSAVAIAVLTLVMCFALAACGDKGGPKTFTVSFDNIEDWDYNFALYNEYGDEFGVGMLNINSWGEKKLANNENTGSCAGEGVTWTCNLYIDGEGNYEISLIAHLKGLGTAYSGEGDLTYMFQGTYEVSNGAYVCDAAEYVKVTLVADESDPWIRNISYTEDFANYIPSAPWSIDSNDADDCDAAKDTMSKVVPSKLTDIFKGATFNVSGDSIVSVVDINW